jgi:hypothetical protein
LGFYLPLQQTHGVLKQELSAAHGSVTRLGESLTRAEASVQRVSAERGELSKFKDRVDSEEKKFPELVERLASEAEAALRSAQEKKQVTLRAMEDGISVGFTSPAFLNRQRTVLTSTGLKLSCSVLKQATKLDLTEVTVRSQTPDVRASEAESAFTTSATLAANVAYQVAKVCGVRPNEVSFGSSPLPNDVLVQLELRPKSAGGRVGL